MATQRFFTSASCAFHNAAGHFLSHITAKQRGQPHRVWCAFLPSLLRRILRLPCADQASQHAQLYSPDPAASEKFSFFSSRQVFCLIFAFFFCKAQFEKRLF